MVLMVFLSLGRPDSERVGTSEGFPGGSFLKGFPCPAGLGTLLHPCSTVLHS